MKNTRFRFALSIPAGTGHDVSLLAIIALVTLIAPWLARIPAQAQQPRVDREQFIPVQPLPPDNVPPMRSIYGCGDDEFWYGALIDGHPQPPAGDTVQGHIWEAFRDWGIKILEVTGSLSWENSHPRFDPLVQAAEGRNGRNGAWNERIIAGYSVSADPARSIEQTDNAGHARQVIFFAFDSVASYYWQCKFLEHKGNRLQNQTQIDPVRLTTYTEQIYSSTEAPPNNVTAGDTVLKQVVYGYNNNQTYRYKAVYENGTIVQKNDTLVQKSNLFAAREHLDMSSNQGKMFLVVTGHMFDPGVSGSGGNANVSGSTPLLRIDIVTEVPQYAYYDHNGALDSAMNGNTEIVFKTIIVPKDSLKPVDPNATNGYDFYREAAYLIDMKEANGPWNDHNKPWNLWVPETSPGHRFDVRVQWTGAEKLALRSITLRDTLAQLQFGHDNASIHYRDNLTKNLRRMLYGPNTNDTSRLGKIIRFYTGDEGYYTRNDGYNWLDSVTYRLFDTANTVSAADTVVRGLRAFRAQSDITSDAQTMTSQNEITCESYFWEASPEQYHNANAADYGVPTYFITLPSIAEHNGGRFADSAHIRVQDYWDAYRRYRPGIPLLSIGNNNAESSVSLDSARRAVENYSRLINRALFGANIQTEKPAYKFSHLTRLGRSAVLSRHTGRRMIQWPGVHTRLEMTWQRDTLGNYYRDTTFAHIPEAAELRAIVNLGLCYGSHGVHYSWVSSGKNSYEGTLVAKDGNGGTGRNYGADWGSIGERVTDMNDRESPLTLASTDGSPSASDAIPDFYTGWGVRTRQMQWMNRTWIPQIWPALQRLRWRDGYSIHARAAQSYGNSTAPVRSLPSTEIITDVRSYAPRDTVVGNVGWRVYDRQDSLDATFVNWACSTSTAKQVRCRIRYETVFSFS